MAVAKSVKHIAIIWHSNSTPCYMPEKSGNTGLWKSLHSNVRSCIIHNDQSKCPSADEWISENICTQQSIIQPQKKEWSTDTGDNMDGS